MVYVIKNKVGNIIAFSDNLDYIYKYLQDYFHRDLPSLYNYRGVYDEYGKLVTLRFYKSDEKLQITITELEDEIKCCDLYVDYDEFEIVPFYGDMVLTVWEYCECKRLFLEYRNDLYDYVELLAKKRLGKIYDKYDKNEIRNYMKRILGMKYDSLINQERFMREIGMDKIRELVNGFGLSLDIYRMNMEYKQKINDDK